MSNLGAGMDVGKPEIIERDGEHLDYCGCAVAVPRISCEDLDAHLLLAGPTRRKPQSRGERRPQ